MMRDPRVRGFAKEFTGNWLAFRRFETNNAVDRERFPQFNNDLREAMFQEPIRYVGDSIQNNRSVLDLIDGDYTFVNPVLARHYGIPGVPGDKDHWVRVEDAGKYGRGGLLPMAVFMTQNPQQRAAGKKRNGFSDKPSGSIQKSRSITTAPCTSARGVRLQRRRGLQSTRNPEQGERLWSSLQ